MGNEIKSTDFFEECGCCGEYHRDTWFGDCRNDEERFNLEEIDEAKADYDTLDEE